MEIFGFLFGLGCLVAIAWAIALLSHAVFGRKPGQRRRLPKQPLSPPEVRERETSAPNLPVQPVSPRRVIVTEQPLAETRVRLPSSRHE